MTERMFPSEYKYVIMMKGVTDLKVMDFSKRIIKKHRDCGHNELY